MSSPRCTLYTLPGKRKEQLAFAKAYAAKVRVGNSARAHRFMGGAVIGNGGQDRRHDGARADRIDADVVRRQRQRHAPAARPAIRHGLVLKVLLRRMPFDGGKHFQAMR